MKRKMSLAIVMLLTILTAKAQRQDLHIHNSFCNGYTLVLYASDMPCGSVTGVSNPIIVPPNQSFPPIEFNGTSVIAGSSIFSWATTPTTSTWYFVAAEVYNTCGVTSGFGCSEPYDYLMTGCPNSGVYRYELSSICASTNPGCNLCGLGAYVQNIGFDYDPAPPSGIPLTIVNGH